MAKELSIEEMCGMAKKINNWKVSPSNSYCYKGSLNGINLRIDFSPSAFSRKIKKVYIRAYYKEELIGETKKFIKDIEIRKVAEYIRRYVENKKLQAQIDNKNYGIKKVREILENK